LPAFDDLNSLLIFTRYWR